MMDTEGTNFVIDDSEYHEVRWVTITEAQAITTDPANLEALTVLGKM